MEAQLTPSSIDNERNQPCDFIMNEIRWLEKWSRNQARALLLEQLAAFWRRDTGIERDALAELERAAPLPHAVIISGLRRAGKSTLLAQLAHRLGEDTFYYVNFEDERFLSFAPDDANDLYGRVVQQAEGATAAQQRQHGQELHRAPGEQLARLHEQRLRRLGSFGIPAAVPFVPLVPLVPLLLGLPH